MARKTELDPYLVEVGGRVRRVREELGWSSVELCRRASEISPHLPPVSNSTVSNLELGQNAIRFPQFVALAMALRVHPEWLVTGQGKKYLDAGERLAPMTPERWELVPPRVRAHLEEFAAFTIEKGTASGWPNERGDEPSDELEPVEPGDLDHGLGELPDWAARGR